MTGQIFNDVDRTKFGFIVRFMEQITVSSAALALRAEKPLTPAMISALWEIAAVLDEERIPANVPNAVWLTIPTARLRGPGARPDNVWLRECLERMTGLKLSGQYRNDEWIAVLLAEAHIVEGGAKVRLLIPPAGVHALRSPGNFVKIETTAAHRLPPHARRLYALLADRKRQREPYAQWSLDNLRGLLGVLDKRAYDDWYQLRKRVLDPAIAAINDFGTVRVKMTPQKVGRSIAAVRFDWHWKDPHEASETVAENERHSAARRKQQAAADAPPMIQDKDSDKVVRAWWQGLTNAEQQVWGDRAGRTFEAGGKTYPRNERDLARAAYALHSEREPKRLVGESQ
jgi:hypothetical protein